MLSLGIVSWGGGALFVPGFVSEGKGYSVLCSAWDPFCLAGGVRVESLPYVPLHRLLFLPCPPFPLHLLVVVVLLVFRLLSPSPLQK